MRKEDEGNPKKGVISILLTVDIIVMYASLFAYNYLQSEWLFVTFITTLSLVGFLILAYLLFGTKTNRSNQQSHFMVTFMQAARGKFKIKNLLKLSLADRFIVVAVLFLAFSGLIAHLFGLSGLLNSEGFPSALLAITTLALFVLLFSLLRKSH